MGRLKTDLALVLELGRLKTDLALELMLGRLKTDLELELMLEYMIGNKVARLIRLLRYYSLRCQPQNYGF
jgi:hypothetical protein